MIRFIKNYIITLISDKNNRTYLSNLFCMISATCIAVGFIDFNGYAILCGSACGIYGLKLNQKG